MRFLLSLLCVLAVLASGRMGYAEVEAPTYQRQRHTARGGYVGRHARGWQQPGYAWPGYGGGFFGHAYSGSWYQRPYPYHFDYYRGRFSPPAAAAAAEN